MPENSWQRPMGTNDTNSYLDDRKDSMIHVWYSNSFCESCIIFLNAVFNKRLNKTCKSILHASYGTLGMHNGHRKGLANSRPTLLHVDIAQKERRCRYFARLIPYLVFGFAKTCIFSQVFASFVCLPDNPL